MTPVRVTPMMPGRAPMVLVRPSRMEAYLGDRSAWFEYKPATDTLARPSAAEISPADRCCLSAGFRPQAPCEGKSRSQLLDVEAEVYRACQVNNAQF